MSDDELPQDADVDDVSSSLNESLTTCRSMIADYRAFLNDSVSQRSDAEEMPNKSFSFERGSNGN